MRNTILVRRRKKCECGICGSYVKPGNRYIQGHSRKGRHCSEEEKKVMKKAQNKPETKSKKSRSMKLAHARIDSKYTESYANPERGRKLSKSIKRAYAKPEVKARHLQGINNPESKEKRRITDQKPEVKMRRSEAMKLVGTRKDTKLKRSISAKIASSRPEEIARRAKSAKENWEDSDKRGKRILSIIKAHAKPEVREKKSNIAKKLWQDPEFVKKQMEARYVKQNKLEKKLEDIVNKIYPKEYKFVGGGEVVIAGKCPDFINVNGQKKIIELFGDYWHQGENPQDRIDIFKPYGYDTLVIWERELKNMEWVKFRIRRFHRR